MADAASYFLDVLSAAAHDPTKLLAAISSDNPILNVLTVTTTVIVAVYVLGLSTGNHSFVDKAWSIVPVRVLAGVG
jgi:steroid 5-alpha reductase family enzyme